PDEKLRAAGLSRAKTAAIKDIAAKTLEGVVPTSRAIARMESELIISQLTSIRGVGPWTVEMLLMFKLGRPDVLPVTDYGVRKGFALTYKLKDLPTPQELLAHGEKWRPYRSIAAWYLWRALD
ncbi:MAG TPA: DNA-3-methyladenine glycosylase 2 family protein, partial [Dongiaceae bacterium]|nr:DNA-3-methyladenine glycosylase 2 family protein [Dongiaceae bacterium]